MRRYLWIERQIVERERRVANELDGGQFVRDRTWVAKAEAGSAMTHNLDLTPSGYSGKLLCEEVGDRPPSKIHRFNNWLRRIVGHKTETSNGNQ